MAMGGVDVMELAFTIGRHIAQPLQMLRLGFGNTFGLLLSLCHRLRIDVKFHRGEGLEKGVDHPGIAWIGRNILADGVRYCCRREGQMERVPPFSWTTILWPHAP